MQRMPHDYSMLNAMCANHHQYGSAAKPSPGHTLRGARVCFNSPCNRYPELMYCYMLCPALARQQMPAKQCLRPLIRPIPNNRQPPITLIFIQQVTQATAAASPRQTTAAFYEHRNRQYPELETVRSGACACPAYYCTYSRTHGT